MAGEDLSKMPICSALQQALLKLIEILEEENAVLQQHRVVRHSGFTDRKNHALRDLMVVQRVDGSVTTLTASRPLLTRLSGALQINAALLKLHISAVGDISDMIIGSLREADSDGTYSHGMRPARR